MSAWPRPFAPTVAAAAPSPPRSSAPGTDTRRDLLRWDAAAVMFFPRHECRGSVDRAGDVERRAACVPGPVGRTTDRPAGAAVAAAGGPGRG